jgi:hypothetical protein
MTLTYDIDIDIDIDIHYIQLAEEFFTKKAIFFVSAATVHVYERVDLH